MKRWELLSLLEALQDAEVALVTMLKLEPPPSIVQDARRSLKLAIEFVSMHLLACRVDPD